MRQSGFIRAGMELNYLVAERPEDVIDMLRDAARRRGAGDAHDESLIEKPVSDDA